jgi:Flp pilus assembly protein TadG
MTKHSILREDSRGPARRQHQLRRRSGSALLYAVVLIPPFGAICMLGADWGRVQMVKAQLQACADGSARYALTGASDGTALTKANWIAGQQQVDGQPLTFAAADVETGTWDKTALSFTPGGSSPSAVRVTARRTVPTLFGAMVGAGDTAVTGQAVATFSVIGYSLVGLNWIVMQGNSTASYSSGSGYSIANQGNIGSNGNIWLGNSTQVKGTAYVTSGKTVSGGSGGIKTKTLSTPLSFPPGDASPYGPNNNDNNLISSNNYNNGQKSFSASSTDNVTLPSGNYFFNDFTVTGSAQVNFSGPTTLYVYGNFSMSGKTTTSGSLPGNLKLVMVHDPNTNAAPGSVTVGSSSAFYGSIYAPESAVSISGSGDVYGSVLGLTVNMSGSGSVWYDTTLETNGGKIQLVQ